MIKKQTLKEVLADSEGKLFLFLGKDVLFTKEEIARFLKKYTISMTTNYEENVVATIESSRLNPVEEDISNEAYDAKIPSFSIEAFDTLLSEDINDDALLMGIKLANDQARIFRFLGNDNISEDLFVKLLMMYQWHEEEEDHRDDRDTIMFTLKRYIDIKPNEADLLHSYLTLRRLATEATNPKLLLALIGFPNFDFLIRGKEKVTLRETIARNRYIDAVVIEKLMHLRDAKVYVALASNPVLGLSLLHTLLAQNNAKINESLASNRQIDTDIFTTLLHKEERTIQLLLWSQPITMERLDSIDNAKIDAEIFATIGANEALSMEVIDTLLQRDNETLLCHLAANKTLSPAQLEVIQQKDIKKYVKYLAMNPATPTSLLVQFYQGYDDDLEIQVALAHNPATPEDILRALFDKDRFEIHRSMASNASVPMDLLDILKVDTRLQSELAKNTVFIQAYEVVLDYDKKSVQF